MGPQTETKKTVKRTLCFVALFLALLLIAVPTGCEIAYNAGLLPDSPSRSLLRAFGADALNDESELVEFLSIGQGDCTIIKSKNAAAVIDFGPEDETDAVYRRLQQLGIDRLDLAVVTHHQSDHMGGLIHFYEHMQVDRLLIGEQSATDGDDVLFKQLIKTATNAGTVLYPPVVGGKYQIGDAVLEILYADKTANEENNRSIVLCLTIAEKRILFTGDLEQSGEMKLLSQNPNISCDVLKLGHHGSNTSSHEAFLKAAAPSFAISSSGYDNQYGHPSDKVLARLESLKIPIYRTDLDKTIRLNFEKGKIVVQTEREGIA